MDRQFMEQYYSAAYAEDPVAQMDGGDPERRNAMTQYNRLNSELADAIGGINTPLWAQIEEMMFAYYEAEKILIKLAYLKGAEDRERMLR